MIDFNDTNKVHLYLCLSHQAIQAARVIVEGNNSTREIHNLMATYELFLDTDLFEELASDSFEYDTKYLLNKLYEISYYSSKILRLGENSISTEKPYITNKIILNQISSEIYTLFIIQKFSIQLKKEIEFEGFSEHFIESFKHSISIN